MATVRTLSQLPEISSTNIDPNDLFEVSHATKFEIYTSPGGERTRVSADAYVSRKITKKNVSDAIVSDTDKHLRDKYKLADNIDFTAIHDELSQVVSADKDFSGTKTFFDNPKITNSAISSFVEDSYDRLRSYSVNYETLRKYNNVNASPSIGPNFGFITQLCGIAEDSTIGSRYLNIFRMVGESPNISATNAPNYIFDQASQKTITNNEYIFKVNPETKESNEWIAPASGIFTCYGWLDEVNDPSQSNENRWVALMGFEEIVGKWTILQVQPFIKNSYISYVGFTFPVKMGLKLKIKVGFRVGTNSNKYANAINSMTNHVANAFIGGVYTGLSADNGNGANYEFSAVAASEYATKDALNELSEHEISCDEKYEDEIKKINDKLSTGGDTTACVKYINPNAAQWYLRTRIVYGDGPNVGVFNPAVRQHIYEEHGVGRDYQCLSISWNETDPTSPNPIIYKKYYAPPTIEEEVEDKPTNYIERAYNFATIPGATVFSDGIYFYYKVRDNSTVIIRLAHDAVSTMNLIKCWLLYDLNRGYGAIKAMPILNKTEAQTYNGQPEESIALPLSAGSILAFGLFAREYINDLPYYKNYAQPPVMAPTTFNTNALSDLLDNPAFKFYTYNQYRANNDISALSRTTWRLPANGQIPSDFASNTITHPNSQYPLSAISFGRIATIYELT